MLIALMDEYQRAAKDYKKVLTTISEALLKKTIAKETKDVDCKSIQTITLHIIQSGYTYTNYINTLHNSERLAYDQEITTPQKGIEEIDRMLAYTQASLDEICYKTNTEIAQWKFETRWNVTYDFEQLMEHAIVHFLRHRRQIENMITTVI